MPTTALTPNEEKVLAEIQKLKQPTVTQKELAKHLKHLTTSELGRALVGLFNKKRLDRLNDRPQIEWKIRI